MDFEGLISWISAHETLMASILGAGAASASIYMLYKKHRQQQAFRKEDRKARLEAARATMPLFLNQINDYGMNCLQLTKKCVRDEILKTVSKCLFCLNHI